MSISYQTQIVDMLCPWCPQGTDATTIVCCVLQAWHLCTVATRTCHHSQWWSRPVIHQWWVHRSTSPTRVIPWGYRVCHPNKVVRTWVSSPLNKHSLPQEPGMILCLSLLVHIHQPNGKWCQTQSYRDTKDSFAKYPELTFNKPCINYCPFFALPVFPTMVAHYIKCPHQIVASYVKYPHQIVTNYIKCPHQIVESCIKCPV